MKYLLQAKKTLDEVIERAEKIRRISTLNEDESMCVGYLAMILNNQDCNTYLTGSSLRNDNSNDIDLLAVQKKFRQIDYDLFSHELEEKHGFEILKKFKIETLGGGYASCRVVDARGSVKSPGRPIDITYVDNLKKVINLELLTSI